MTSPDTEHRWCCNEVAHKIPDDCFFIDAPCDIPGDILDWYRAKAEREPWMCPVCLEIFPPEVKRAEGWDCCQECFDDQNCDHVGTGRERKYDGGRLPLLCAKCYKIVAFPSPCPDHGAPDPNCAKCYEEWFEKLGEKT